MASIPLVIVWSSYAGYGRFALAALLFFVSAGIVMYGRRLKSKIFLPKMGKIIGAIVIVIWAFSILAFLKINRDLARYTGSAGNLGPIFPITLATAFCTFGYVAYTLRGNGPRSSLGNGFLALIAGPMVFELPFLLIVIPQVSAPLVPALIFLIPLFTIIFTTLSMLFLSRKIAVTRDSVYFFGAMIFVFGVWALQGYSYPSHPIPFLLNAASKILGFCAVATMFVATKDYSKADSHLAKGALTVNKFLRKNRAGTLQISGKSWGPPPNRGQKLLRCLTIEKST